MPWILVNKVYSKVREFSNFHNEWKTEVWRDDKNVKVAANVKDDNTIQVDLIKRAYQKSSRPGEQSPLVDKGMRQTQ